MARHDPFYRVEIRPIGRRHTLEERGKVSKRPALGPGWNDPADGFAAALNDKLIAAVSDLVDQRGETAGSVGRRDMFFHRLVIYLII